MNYKAIPGFEKFEIAETGEIRNVKTLRETKPYHTSDKTGPMVHLLDSKAGTEARLSVLKLVKELFGVTVKGWDIDPDTIAVKITVEKKPRLSAAEKQAREDAKAKAKAEKKEAREAAKTAKAAAKAAQDVASQAPVVEKKAKALVEPVSAPVAAVVAETEPETVADEAGADPVIDMV